MLQNSGRHVSRYFLLPFISRCSLVVTKRLYQNEVTSYLATQFPDKYSQQKCEQFWADIWHKSELFKQDDTLLNNSIDTNTFQVLLPPPNITGSLHLGHALTVSIQDALCRYHRMHGRQVNWLGGTDHAGIATQMVIEKLLWSKMSKTRHDVSREEFDHLFEQWKVEKISQIKSQLRAMGASIDFDKDYFTLSPQMSAIVSKAFIELFNRGLIYRSFYMVNWSYYLQSTLSDIEMEHKFISKPTEYQVPDCEEKFTIGVLHQFKYPLDREDSSEFVRVATTRIESLIGDVALCVHPNDQRYSQLVGRYAFNPFTKQLMPILADEAVKPDFGTGVLKLTPAHSAIDHEIAQRHQLPMINIFNDRGYIECAYEPLNGVHRYAAKQLMVNELCKRGLYCGFEEHHHWLPVCSRSGDIIESRIVPQWFLKCDHMRYLAEFVVNRDNLTEVSQKRWQQLKETLPSNYRNISLVPSSYRNTWKDWFSRYKDWCISRQIFWGHRIPAYQVYRNSCPTDYWVAAKSQEEALKLAIEKYDLPQEEISVQQDSDVLDTWFSSGLLPLAVTGGLEKNRLNQAPPLSLMETGHDIIFFWVARMVLLSLLLAQKLPFTNVLLHGMICDSNGKKMSKSRGNVVDPMHLIEGASLENLVQQNKQYLEAGLMSDQMFTEVLRKTISSWPNGLPVCGADVLRLSLLQSNFKEQNVNFDLSKTVKKRVFANKMHQTMRFLLLHLDEHFNQLPLDHNTLSSIDRWILGKLYQLTDKCEIAFCSYDLHSAAKHIEHFWIQDLCDVYLENVKTDIIRKSDSYLVSLNLLVEIVRVSLRLMHPFMPFITENLYQQLEYSLCALRGEPYYYHSILQQPYPSKQDELLKPHCYSLLDECELVFAIVRKIRWFKQTFFINREPLVERIRIASLQPSLSHYRKEIASALKLSNCELEFVNLHDIYHFDDCYCAQVVLNEPDDESVSETRPKSNSLHSEEIYVLFTLDKDKLISRLSDKKLKLKQDKIQSLLEELEQLHSQRFGENYKRLTKIVS